MKRQLLAIVAAAGLALAPTLAIAQPGQMVFDQGCDAFDLVEDLEGVTVTPLGISGRWLMANLETDEELVYAWESVDLLPAPQTDPAVITGTTFVAWEFEGTGIQGTNRTSYVVNILDLDLNITLFFEADTFRGNRYKSGGGSGSGTGVLGASGTYDIVRFVLCKSGFGGGKGG